MTYLHVKFHILATVVHLLLLSESYEDFAQAPY
jgi:hypothetical protein